MLFTEMCSFFLILYNLPESMKTITVVQPNFFSSPVDRTVSCRGTPPTHAVHAAYPACAQAT